MSSKLVTVLVISLVTFLVLIGCAAESSGLKRSGWYKKNLYWFSKRKQVSNMCIFGYNDALFVGKVAELHVGEHTLDYVIFKPAEVLESVCKIEEEAVKIFLPKNKKIFTGGVTEIGERWAFAASANAKGHWYLQDAVRMSDLELAE